jgi:uncharacterized protein (TIGR03067 family)
MRARLLLFISLMLLTGFAPAPFERTKRADSREDELRMLQGTWLVVSKKYDVGDRDFLDEQTHFTIANRRMTCTVNGEIRSERDIHVDPAARPRALTKTMVGRAVVLEAIYRFDGDRLILCQSEKRPTAFESRGRCWLMVMKRR